MGKALERAALVLPRGYLHGLTLSTAGASATFSVALGEAVDDSFTSLMTTAGLSKTTSAWAVGTATGSLDTGSIAVSTWYHVYLIKRPDTGVVDVLTSLSATVPTMPTNYTLKRRIGSMKTNGSSQWTQFAQTGDEFRWFNAVADINMTATFGTAATDLVLSAPLGVQTVVGFSAVTSSGNNIYLMAKDQSNAQGASATVTASGLIWAPAQIMTDLASKIQGYSQTASKDLFIVTTKYIDIRGKLS